MRKALFLLLLFPAFIPLAAQDIDKIAQLTCDCVETKNLAAMPKGQVEMTLGLCMFEASKTAGFEMDPTDQAASTELGRKVGIQMVTKCPAVFSQLTGYLAEKKEELEEVKEEFAEATGKVKSVDVDEFVTVTVKEPSGKEVKYLWLRYFSGSDEFVVEPKKLVGKKVKLTYREIECFMPKAGGYFKKKELASMEIE